MAYSDFTLESATTAFNLSVLEHSDLIAGVSGNAPSDWLSTYLRTRVSLGRAINTGKARSELMIAPVLAEVRIRHADRCSLFSCTEINVDSALGLRGYCDFILSRSPIQHMLSAPVLMIAESKNSDLPAGYGQCIAGMYAARVFNERRNSGPSKMYGAVSTGELWAFLMLVENDVTLDMQVYHIDEVAKILGMLVKLVTE